MTLRWLFLILSIGISAGLSSALFLWSLDIATSTFTRNPQLIYGLPAAGGLIAYITYYAGAAANQGNNAIIRAIKGDLKRVPLLMAPLILITTLLTHLCGGSAGREGTAVQMSGSLADTLLSRFAIPQSERSLYLRAAMALARSLGHHSRARSSGWKCPKCVNISICIRLSRVWPHRLLPISPAG
jgi:H+/Cl- antiporter ClcA